MSHDFDRIIRMSTAIRVEAQAKLDAARGEFEATKEKALGVRDVLVSEAEALGVQTTKGRESLLLVGIITATVVAAIFLLR